MKVSVFGLMFVVAIMLSASLASGSVGVGGVVVVSGFGNESSNVTVEATFVSLDAATAAVHVDPVTFGTASEVTQLSSGRYMMSVFTSGSDDPLLQHPVVVSPGAVAVVAVSVQASGVPLVTTSELDPQLSRKVRFVNATGVGLRLVWWDADSSDTFVLASGGKKLTSVSGRVVVDVFPADGPDEVATVVVDPLDDDGSLMVLVTGSGDAEMATAAVAVFVPADVFVPLVPSTTSSSTVPDVPRVPDPVSPQVPVVPDESTSGVLVWAVLGVVGVVVVGGVGVLWFRVRP